jgi:hypothetical protein
MPCSARRMVRPEDGIAAQRCTLFSHWPAYAITLHIRMKRPWIKCQTGFRRAVGPASGSWFHGLTRLVTAPPVAVRPPSTTNCPPVVLEARSEQRKSTMLAISSTVV